MPDWLRGIIPPVLTPFHDDESLNPAGLAVLLDRLVLAAVQAVFVAGSASEFYALGLEEIKTVIETTVEVVNRRVPVIAGTGRHATREAIDLSRFAEAAGVDAVSVLTPFYVTPGEEDLYRHYRAVAEAVSIPVLVYINPARAGGVTVPPRIVGRLAVEVPNICGIKDSSTDLNNLFEYQRHCPPGFAAFTGQDTLIVDYLLHGGAGGVPGLANIVPELTVEIYRHAEHGDIGAALEAQRKLFPLRAAYGLGPFPLVLKEMAALLGLPVGPVRRPLCPLPEARRAELQSIMQAAHIL